jgi:hypothetical protein
MNTRLFFTFLLLSLGFGHPDAVADYVPREGDILFQSLSHSPLVDSIDGVTRSPYSHCGIVAKRGHTWIVIEAIGPVREIPLKQWKAQGRKGKFWAYRLNAELAAKIPDILKEARKFSGRPYDIHYRFDDEHIYCSELIFKAAKKATGHELGKVEKLGDLNWQPHQDFIRSIEGDVPLDREMITPRALSEARELSLVHGD